MPVIDFCRCNPSINMQLGAPKDSEFTQGQTYITVTALARGYYVSIADADGQQAAWGMSDLLNLVIQDGWKC
jgi:hypothetical protein